MTAPALALGIDIGGTSIKLALMDGEREVWTGRSGEYARPGRGELVGALERAIGESPLREGGSVVSVGVCAPGVRDERGVIVRAVNVPGLEGVSCAELLAGTTLAMRQGRGTFEFTDAYAAAVDWWWTAGGGNAGMGGSGGRVLALSMGTGIGACVLDVEDGRPRALIVTGGGPGHVGQMDVGEMEEKGADGKKASSHEASRHRGRDLESYMGLPALRARFGDVERGLGELRADRMPLMALVRAVRVCHAIYRPQRVVLLGGVGMALGGLVGEIREHVADGLTPLARDGWTLEVGTTNFHAARGAARLAMEGGV